ncbi:thioredoxin family protein [Bremerella cremea]|uniref:Thioredoxin family protein n=1 Tax=Bremerella cremea TaxID=1031537 RepID=A0A368KQK2_9BACT|nr:thioredoxin family protein [Bremerella cremea]RCS48306.1 thioredoxin family protein [Bremerella cremea]
MPGHVSRTIVLPHAAIGDGVRQLPFFPLSIERLMLPYFRKTLVALGFLATLLLAHVSRAEESTSIAWRTNFAAAKAEAKKEGKSLFLFFTGSDWCVVCKRLEAAALHDEQFVNAIEQSFIPVMLDFPTGFELEDALAQQNEALSEKYDVHAFPTLLAIDLEGKIFGQIIGFNGDKPKLLADIQQMNAAGEVLAAITHKGGVDAVDDPQQLAAFLDHVPNSVLGAHWNGLLQQALVKSEQSDPELHKTLLLRQSAIEKQMAADLVQQKIEQMFRSGVSPAEQIKVLETMLTEAEENDEIKKSVYLQYSAMLSHAGRHEESLTWAQKVTNAPWAGQRERYLGLDFQIKQLFRLNRIDEGMALFPELYQASSGEADTPREAWIPGMAAQELFFAGRYQEAAAQTALALAKSKPDSSDQARIYFFGSASLAALATDFELRGEYLLGLANYQQNNAQKALRQAEAAVCFAAAGAQPKAEQTLANIEPLDPEKTPPEIQKQLAQIHKAIPGTQVDALKYLMTLPNAPREKLKEQIEALEN